MIPARHARDAARGYRRGDHETRDDPHSVSVSLLHVLLDRLRGPNSRAGRNFARTIIHEFIESRRPPSLFRALLTRSSSCLMTGVRSRARQALGPRQQLTGASVYRDHCAGCHDGADWRAPTVDSLRLRSPQAIVDALTSGSMRYQGLSLSGAERRSVAEFVTGRPLRAPAIDGAIGRCGRNLPAFADPLGVALLERLEPDARQHALPARIAGGACRPPPSRG